MANTKSKLNDVHVFEEQNAIQAFLADKTLPNLDERQYQRLADYLHSANTPLGLAVAEVLFRHQKEHPYALGLFLACVYPMAQRSVSRLMVLSGFGNKDLTQELMFNGAVLQAIQFFQTVPYHEDTIFRAALYFRLKTGALSAIFNRDENDRVEYFPSVDSHACPAGPRIVEQLFAEEMLDKIAALKTEPNERIAAFVRSLVQLGPQYVLLPSTRSRSRSRTHCIDYEEVCDELGISYTTACHYLAAARKILQRTFNPDGCLFTKAVTRAI